MLIGGGQEVTASGYTIELRLGSPTGAKIGEGLFKTVANAGPEGRPMGMLNITLSKVDTSKPHDIYVVSQPVDDEDEMVAMYSIEFKAK